MKVDFRKNSIISILFLLFIIAGSSFLLNFFQKTSSGNETIVKTETAVSENNRSVYFDETAGLDESVLEPVSAYYKSFFDALGSLESQNLGQYFYQGDAEAVNAAYFDQKFQDTVISIRNAQPVDLRFSDYAIGLKITDSRQISESQIEISLEENQEITFNRLTDTPSLSRVKNRFVLGYLDDKWQILDHEREEDLFVSMSEELEGRLYPGVSTTALIDEINQKNISESLAEIDQQKQNRINMREIISKRPEDISYSREEAVAYANQYALTRNPEYPYYDDTGGNCNNFISQCLKAGGMEMDYSGNNRWFYDGEATDSWINVDYFYDYARNNTGSGFRAAVNDNLYSGEIGDIIQYGQNGNFKHSVIISGLIKNREGDTIDYLIDSNTTDRLNYPASAYGYTQFRLIKVQEN